ncbi:MAG: oxidoreductase [Deltaproteobacteria bacterium HGW-Deltaproteobacteria-19]|nr:MAG: oxidoreductase [Deltaproteobacteria bacterium HGW-Deltaproteobacteria-19]
MSDKSVLLLGATGLVGGECLKLLLSVGDYQRIIVPVRSPLPMAVQDPRLEVHPVDFEQLDSFAGLFAVNHIISCLGTTIGKAGSRERFRRVDFTYAYETASGAAENGASHLLLVTALGADASSRIFYNRVKGELEQAVRGLPFQSVSIFRPSLILGDRRESRMGESIGKTLSGLLGFAVPDRYKPVAAGDLARAILAIARESRPGFRIIESDAIRRIARNIAV